MAANADATYRAIAGELARRTGLSVTCLDDLPWQDRQRVLEDGQADVGAICGAVYVCLVGKPTARVQLLAAPVMRGARYHGRPVYFSDLVMRADANIETFADLRGTRLGYNEPRSYSGYLVLRAHLAAIGEERGYFRHATEAGSHQAALRTVIAGATDVAAIDSIVLERELQLHPDLPSAIRIVHTLGPSPIPPLVAARGLPAATTRALRDALLHMHEDAEGRSILHAGLLSRFVAVEDADYNPIREQLQRARSVELVDTHSQHL